MASGFTKNRLKISQSCPLWDRSPADRIDGVSGAGRGSLKDPSRIPQRSLEDPSNADGRRGLAAVGSRRFNDVEEDQRRVAF